MTNLKTIFAILFIFLSLTSEAQDRRSWKNPGDSPTGGKNFKKVAATDDKNKWTLKDWLEQKDRNKMMDLWLGMYAPSPYEFIFSLSQLDYKSDIDNPVSTTNYKSWQGSAYFYAMVLGIGALYENNWNEGFQDVQGSINLRVAGNSNESTHFNLFAGLRNRTDSAMQLRGQPFGGLELEIYIQHTWGLHGNYRYFMSKDEATVGSVFGDRSEAGIFIDIEKFRIFGNWYSENFNSTTAAGVATNRVRSGILSGLRILL